MQQPVEQWKQYAVRMANEGLPIGAIARSVAVPGDEIRELLMDALALGKILEMPAPDWPPTAKRRDQVPRIVGGLAAMDHETLAILCVKAFGLTPLQGAVFALLLRHHEVSKEKIHAVIEERRSRRTSKSSLEETDLKMVDVVICHIRRRMKEFYKGKTPVVTLWGAGYFIPKELKEIATTLINGV